MIVEMASVASPIGEILVAVHDGRLCGLDFREYRTRLERRLGQRFGAIELRPRRDPAGVATRLRRYFRGDVEALAGVAVDPGGTTFQRAVWREMRKVRAGGTVSYQDLARRVGAPRAVRAVGAASGANPIGIVVPCHRVLRSDGQLGGYAGGLGRKQWLLRHEGVELGQRQKRSPMSRSIARALRSE